MKSLAYPAKAGKQTFPQDYCDVSGARLFIRQVKNFKVTAVILRNKANINF
jgi:hypothetical protein